MPWVKIDDQILADPKFLRAVREGGSAVVHLWLAMVAYSARNLTDGLVPEDMLEDIHGPRRARDRDRALRALEENDLLTREDGPGSPCGRGVVAVRSPCGRGVVAVRFRLVNYLKYNPSASTVRAARERDTERKRKQRLTKNVPPGHPEGHPPGHPPGHPAGLRPESKSSRARYPVPSHITPPQRVGVIARSAAASTENLDKPEPELDDGRSLSHPQGEPTVWRTLAGWEPPEGLEGEAVMAGVPKTVFAERLAELRNKPIGGRSGVLDRTDYVRRQFGRWKSWGEQERAAGRATGLNRSADVDQGTRGHLRYEPDAETRDLAAELGVDLGGVVATARKLPRFGELDTPSQNRAVQKRVRQVSKRKQ